MYDLQTLRQYAGAGSSLEFIGKDEDARPVFAGYWDDGTPVTMVGEPSKWVEVWSGSSNEETFDEDLFRATQEARRLCGLLKARRGGRR